jgi:predicted DNA-binding transcriptional regulator AlpA
MKSQVPALINASVPPSGFLRLKQVLQVVPIGRSTLYQKMKLGTFPRAIKLGPRISAWRAADINDYVQNPR